MTSDPNWSWSEYLATDFAFADYSPGSRVLDIGFGGGHQMRHLLQAGHRPYGVEYDGQLALRAQSAGFAVSRAKAEALPFRDESLDGIVCKVVIPYTDEARAIAEMARVLRPDGVAHVSFHGLGYSLRYLARGNSWKNRVYGARVIVNTAVYAVSGRRLPGFTGDTLYQARKRLRRYYKRAGLEVIRDHPAPTFLGSPVFIYHTLRRVALPASGEAARTVAVGAGDA